MKAIITYTLGAFTVLMLLFGFIASKHVDDDKLGSFPKERISDAYGPLVPEDILTPRGRKWAFLRNCCAAVALGGVTLYGIVMALWGEWN